MVVRFTVFMGILLGAVSWILLVPLSPGDFQASPGTNIAETREAGLVPPIGQMVMSGEIGHSVFEIPDTDATHLAMATIPSDGVADMKGMPMGEQDRGHVEQAVPGMPMGGQEEVHGDQPMPTMAPSDDIADMKGMPMGEQGRGHVEQAVPTMAMGDGATEMKGMPMGEQDGGLIEQPVPGMAMGGQEEVHGDQPMPTMAPSDGIADMKGMPMGERDRGHVEQAVPTVAMGAPAGHDEKAEEGHGGGSGLSIMNAAMAGMMAGRTVEIEMAEWGFSPGNLTVKSGEIVRFVVRNNGNIPHEFMFMEGAAMEAVNYRLERADWNLLEHEAPFERPIVLPGDSFEVVIRIDQPGTWMFMCMFPYHMQFGMMGMMMTEGAVMDMGGMKM